jgi:hypothetical protein
VSAATATYTPQPGTIPHRVIAWLQRQPVGSDFSTAEIADALNIEISGGSLSPFMQGAVKAGVVSTRKDGRLIRWSLGDGKPLPEPEDRELDEPLSKAPAIPADPSKWRLPFSPATPTSPKLEPELRAKRKSKPDLASYVAAIDERHPPDPVAQEQGMCIALWSTGTLEIRRAGADTITLTAEETKQLLHYLECVAQPGAAT